MGLFQLPGDVDGDAAGVIAYTALCLLSNLLLVWLLWTHNDSISYIACITYCTLLSTTTSIIQQWYDFIWWRDIITEQFYYSKANAGDAQVQYQKGVTGLKLVLSVIRMFSTTVASTFVFFFALSLAATVWGWWAKSPRYLHNLSVAGRTIPILLGTVTIVMMELDLTHHEFFVYMAVANAQLIISLIGGAVFLALILVKYVQSQRQLKAWDPIHYGQGQTGSTSLRSIVRGRALSGSNRTTIHNLKRPNSTLDNWVVVRLTVALVFLCVFEYLNIAPKFSAKGRAVDSLTLGAPDLSEKKALSSVRGYLSGVTPSLIAFIVFGTTKTFQRKMYDTFMPSIFRKKKVAKDGDSNAWKFKCTDAPELPSSTRASILAHQHAAASQNQEPEVPMGDKQKRDSQPEDSPDLREEDIGLALTNDAAHPTTQRPGSVWVPLSKFNPAVTKTATTQIWSGRREDQ